MKREWLKELNLSDEQIDKIMKENGNDIENAKSTVKESYKEIESENKSLNDAIKDRDKQLEDLKKAAGDSEELKTQIADMQKANAEAIKAKEAEIAKIKLENAVEKALTENKAINAKAVAPFLNLDGAEIAEDGTVKGLAEQIEALKTGEGTSFLFKADTTPKPSVTGATPATGQAPTQTDGWAAKLAEARKNGDNLSAIAIKRQAMEEGVNLL